MKKEQLFTMYKTINGLAGLRGVKFAYAMLKNKNTIEVEIKTIRESLLKLEGKFLETEKDFLDKKKVLLEKYSLKDKEGNSVIVRSEYQINPTKKEEFETKVIKLKKNFSELMDEIDRVNSENDKLLKEESDLKLHKIKLEDVPKELSMAQLEPIMELIEEK